VLGSPVIKDPRVPKEQREIKEIWEQKGRLVKKARMAMLENLVRLEVMEIKVTKEQREKEV
jgi:hypothetical protein